MDHGYQATGSAVTVSTQLVDNMFTATRASNSNFCLLNIHVQGSWKQIPYICRYVLSAGGGMLDLYFILSLRG